MKVALRRSVTTDGVNLWALTVGREYEVLGLSDDHFRLLDDTGKPYLYPRDCFEVIDPIEPSFWVSKWGEEGERYSDPPGWGEPGFYEDWHDGVEEVRRTFDEQLAKWYPGAESSG